MKKDIEVMKKDVELEMITARNKIDFSFNAISELVGQGSHYYNSVENINLLVVKIELYIDDLRYAMLDLAQCNAKMETLQEIENLYDTSDSEFGECKNCGFEFNSELLDEYEINHCPKCGAKILEND